MRNSTAFATLLISLSLAGAAPALAQEGKGFGEDGQIILSAERLFGLSFSTIKNEDGGGGSTTTFSHTSVSLLWPNWTGVTSSVPTPYELPHAAFDVVVASGFTVGGSIGFVSGSGTTKSEQTGAPSQERDAPSTTLFAFAPRIGFALPLSDQFAFWPRVGVTYYHASSESTSSNVTPTVTTTQTFSGLGLNLEPMFVFSPVSHFGITMGPVLDFPLSGSSSTERSPQPAGMAPSADDKLKFTNYGLTIGVLGYI